MRDFNNNLYPPKKLIPTRTQLAQVRSTHFTLILSFRQYAMPPSMNGVKLLHFVDINYRLWVCQNGSGQKTVL